MLEVCANHSVLIDLGKCFKLGNGTVIYCVYPNWQTVKSVMIIFKHICKIMATFKALFKSLNMCKTSEGFKCISQMWLQLLYFDLPRLDITVCFRYKGMYVNSVVVEKEGLLTCVNHCGLCFYLSLSQPTALMPAAAFWRPV